MEAPTTWPINIHITADYLNSLRVPMQESINAAAARAGNPTTPLNDDRQWAILKVPKFNSDQVVGGPEVTPIYIMNDTTHGLYGIGTEIGQEKDRLNALARAYHLRWTWDVIGPKALEGSGVVGEPSKPADYDEWRSFNSTFLTAYEAKVRASMKPPIAPVDPIVLPPPEGEPPVQTCPPGTQLVMGKCVPNEVLSPPGGTVPSPTSGQDLRFGTKFNITCRWDATARNMGSGPALAQKHSELSGVFKFFSVDNWEIVAKRADLRPIGGKDTIAFVKLTDVPFTITVTNLEDGSTTIVQSFDIPEAKWIAFA